MTIDKVIFQERGIDHEDARRTLSTAFNGDFGGFTAKQTKVYKIHQDAQLAGHFHKYQELLYVIDGELDIQLVDIETKEENNYSLKANCSILIPAQVAHKVFVKKGTTMIGCTEEPFVSPEVNDTMYDF